jgi:pilus assembly protein CpaC
MSQRSLPARPWPRPGLVGAALLAASLGLVGLALGAGAPAQAQTVIGTEGTIGVEVRKGLVVRLDRPAASVFVADPDIADIQAQSSTLIYLFGRRAGTTTLYAVDENDDLVARRTVVVSHDLTRLRAAFESLLPDAAVRVASIDGSIVLDGEVGSPAAADEARQIAARFLGDGETLMNRIQVAASTQVHLRVRVAEVGRDITKQFGINWENIFRTGNFVFGFAQGRDVINNAGQFLRSPDGAGQIAGGYRSGSADINAIIDAFEREGLVNVLAEPNLTAISGETASFLAGGEFPIPVGVRDGEVTVQFKEFGVSLAFTPTVLSPSRISLKVRPEVSEITERGAVVIQGFTIPALATRRAETTVELASGQSFAIGGLISTDVQSAVQKFPGLGDLPVLGTLFRSHNFQRNETELVILVTPYVVNPINASAAATPGEGFRAPSDVERILEGRLHRTGVGRGAGGAVGRAGARLVGPVGFVLE